MMLELGGPFAFPTQLLEERAMAIVDEQSMPAGHQAVGIWRLTAALMPAAVTEARWSRPSALPGTAGLTAGRFEDGDVDVNRDGQADRPDAGEQASVAANLDHHAHHSFKGPAGDTDLFALHERLRIRLPTDHGERRGHATNVLDIFGADGDGAPTEADDGGQPLHRDDGMQLRELEAGEDVSGKERECDGPGAVRPPACERDCGQKHGHVSLEQSGSDARLGSRAGLAGVPLMPVGRRTGVAVRHRGGAFPRLADAPVRSGVAAVAASPAGATWPSIIVLERSTSIASSTAVRGSAGCSAPAACANKAPERPADRAGCGAEALAGR